jgi:RNA polymerase sigma-70 factor (ECF subfamily)
VDDPTRILWLETHIFLLEKEARAWLAKHVRSLTDDDINDLVQEAYARLWAADLSQIQQPRAYFYRMLRNLSTEKARRAQIIPMERLGEIDELIVPSDEPGPEQRFAIRQELQRFLRLIDALPAQCKRVYELRRIWGLRQSEVAKEMKLSERTVENHLAHAQRLLTDALTRNDARGSHGSPQVTRRGRQTEQH